MKLHHFRDVVAIAEQGSLRAAARHLQLAQPALTRSLGELERELGVPLFERQSKGMVLTPVGETFVKRANLVLHEVRRARDDVEQQNAGAAGSVVVGLSIAAHTALLPRALRPFHARFPNVRLHLIEGFFPTLENGLRNGTIDFYIGPQPDGKVPAPFSCTPLFENERTILCRKGHSLAKARSLGDLVAAEWATTSITQRAEEELNSLFQAHDLPPPRLILRSQSALTLIVSLLSSDFLAMAPVQWMAFAPTKNLLASIPVRETLPAPTIVLIQRAAAPLTPAATFLLDMLLRAIPRTGGAVARER